MTTHPTTLYHGSRYRQHELMPGFLRSGELVQWDETESNRFLYATTSELTAQELGFASSLEKIYNVDRFHVHNGKIFIQTPDRLTMHDLAAVVVYIYAIDYLEKDGWMKNNNKHNGIETEYKTNKTIHAIRSCAQLEVANWLNRYKVVIGEELPELEDGRSKEMILESIAPAWLNWK